MATYYKVKYLCLACGHRREIDTKNKIRNFFHRKCPFCRHEHEKVIYLGEYKRDKQRIDTQEAQ